MSGGGTNTVQTNSAPPPQFLNAYQNAMNYAQGAVNNPEVNPVAPVAPMTDQQYAGITNVNSMQGSENPYNALANNYIQQSQNQLLPQYQPYAGAAQGLYQQGAQQINPTQFSAGNVNQYLSPYNQDVVQATEAQFANTNAQQQQGVTGNAVSAGAWGGDRSAVAQGIMAGQQQTAEAPVIAGLENQNYAQALGEFNTQQQVGVGAQEASQQLQQAAGQGIAGIGATTLGGAEAQNYLASQGGFAETNLGNTQLQEGLSTGNAEIGTGELFQAQNQAQLNAPYEAQLAAAAYPFQQAQFLANVAEGVGSNAGGQSTTTSPGPSAASQAAGYGTAAIGAIGLLGLLNRGGAVQRAPGGIIPGMPSFGPTGSTGISGGASGIPGVVSIIPDTTPVHGSGAPRPPNVPPPQQTAGQQITGDIAALKGLQSANGTNAFHDGIQKIGGWFGGNGDQSASPDNLPVPPIPPPGGDPNAPMSIAPQELARGGGIAFGPGGMIPHMAGPRGPHSTGMGIPRMGGMGGIGSHPFHPPGLGKFDSGGGISAYPNQTANEVAMMNSSTDSTDALATSMAAMSNPAMAAASLPMQAQARGGGIRGFADGGGTDQGTWDDAPSSSPPVTVQGATEQPGQPPAVQTSVTPTDTGTEQGTFDNPPPKGGIAGGGGGNQAGRPDNKDIWTSVLAAGLGMLGGTSPHASVNIGRGALEGLQYGEQMKKTDIEAEKVRAETGLRAQQIASEGDWRKGMLGVNQQKANTGDQRADWLHQDAMQRMQLQHDDRDAALQVSMVRAMNAQAAEGAGRWSYAGTDPSGMPILLNGKTGETKVGNTAIGMKPGEAARVQQGNARQDALTNYRNANLAQRQQHDKEMLDAGYTKDEISLINAGLGAGAPVKPEEAQSTVNQLRAGQHPLAGNTPASAAPQPLPLPSTQKDLVPGKVYGTKLGAAKWNGTEFEAIQQ